LQRFTIGPGNLHECRSGQQTKKRGRKAAPFTMSHQQTINLESFLARILLKQTRVDNAKQALTDAEEDLRQTKEAEKRALIACLDRGETTGSPLKDVIYRHVGLDEEVVKKVVAFSDQLVAAQDQYVLFRMAHEEPFMHVMAPSPGHENTMRTVYAFVLGKLTGAPLEAQAVSGIEGVTAPNFTLPFSAYVTWTSDEDPKEKKNGPLVLDDSLFIGFVGDWLTNQSLFTKLAYPPEVQIGNLRYYIGPVSGETLGPIVEAVGGSSGIMDIMKALEILQTDSNAVDTSGAS
jgi:hypothetical protein